MMNDLISRKAVINITAETGALETQARVRKLPSANGWINCEERLPEPETMVIVACYGSDIIIPKEGETVKECCARLQRECVRVMLGFIGSDGWYDCEYSPLIIKPTYWQPLPEPPKEK